MLTVEELASVPLFSQLPFDELERLAKRAADIHLATGDYAVHEGEERALFAVLAGSPRLPARWGTPCPADRDCRR